jgi:alcohol dehydrogenase (NADP+)
MTIIAYGISEQNAELGPLAIERRAVGPKDINIDITHCGICHTDLHEVHGESGWTKYPLVPGHEIVGRVTAVGAGVTRFSVGDAVGVGCMVDSCRKCSCCLAGLEQFCEADATYTYGGIVDEAPGYTLHGYSQRIVVDEDFVLRIRHRNDQLAATAPFLCAGITIYSPLRLAKAGPGVKAGIAGIGGLGHLGIKLARAMGAHVVS